MDDNTHGQKDDLGARIGRAAGRFVKQATPRARQMAADAKPLVDKATQYAVDHQDELKAAGAKVLRSRVAGPWGMAFDAVANAAKSATPSSAPETPAATACAKCGAENPKGSKFCNQCAAALS